MNDINDMITLLAILSLIYVIPGAIRLFRTNIFQSAYQIIEARMDRINERYKIIASTYNSALVYSQRYPIAFKSIIVFKYLFKALYIGLILVISVKLLLRA